MFTQPSLILLIVTGLMYFDPELSVCFKLLALSSSLGLGTMSPLSPMLRVRLFVFIVVYLSFIKSALMRSMTFVEGTVINPTSSTFHPLNQHSCMNVVILFAITKSISVMHMYSTLSSPISAS